MNAIRQLGMLLRMNLLGVTQRLGLTAEDDRQFHSIDGGAIVDHAAFRRQ